MKITRRLSFLLLLPVLALFAASCGSDDDSDSSDNTTTTAATATTAPTTTAPTATASAEPLRIAIVAPSASTDLAFSQSIVEGVGALGSDVEVEITDGIFIVEDAAMTIRGYAQDGFDLVIAHGSQYGGSLQEIAPDFPDVSFAWGPHLTPLGWTMFSPIAQLLTKVDSFWELWQLS